MTIAVEKLAEQVKALPKRELEEFLTWLADYEQEHSDAWDKEIERDFKRGGRLSSVLDRVRGDIAAERTKPPGEVIDNT